MTSPKFPSDLEDRRLILTTRRQFLLAAAGGSLAVLFGLTPARAVQRDDDWAVVARVQELLLPSEPGSPGATDVGAFEYLKTAMQEERIDSAQRDFILHGVYWLQDAAMQQHEQAFLSLNAQTQQALLERISESDAGENWLSTLLVFVLEALLSAPVYGGNRDAVGWRWLAIEPGFPLPDRQTVYWKLPK